ncbi:MFS transporter [Leuconostoc citreum]
MKKRMITGVFVLGIFICMLDTTIMNVSLPNIGLHLDVGLDKLSWALNIYIILFAALTIPLTRLAEFFGMSKGFLLGAIVFGIGSIISAFAGTLMPLLLGRAIQSIGAGLVFPLAMTLAIRIVADRDRTHMIAILGVTQGLAAALGPTIGGVVTQYMGWRWIFLINVPIIVLMISMGLLYLPLRQDIQNRQSIDLSGAIFSTIFLSTLSLVLMQGRVWGWHNWLTYLCAIVSLLSFIFFIMIERVSINPMVPLQLFKNRAFALSAIIIVFSNLFLVATTVILPNYFTNVAGMDTLQASFLIAPISFSVFIFAPIAGFAKSHISVRWLISSGFLMMAVGYLWLGTKALQSVWQVIIAGILIGSSYGMITGPILVIAAGTLQGKLLTASQSVTGVLRQVGIMLAVALFVTGLYSGLTQAQRHANSYAQEQINDLHLPKQDTAEMIQKVQTKMKASVFTPTATQGLPTKVATAISRIEKETTAQYRHAFEKLYLIAIPFMLLLVIMSLFLTDKSDGV